MVKYSSCYLGYKHFVAGRGTASSYRPAIVEGLKVKFCFAAETTSSSDVLHLRAYRVVLHEAIQHYPQDMTVSIIIASGPPSSCSAKPSVSVRRDLPF